MSERFDVVVVGSGAGGAPGAHTLALAGARVLVLEKGPRLGPQDFLHDEIDTCRRDTFVPFPDDDPHTLRRTPEGRATATSAGWISRCVGGGTVHMSGFFFRFQPKDFALRESYGPLAGSTAIDWPFGYDTLAPWYDHVERVVGVSGDVTRNPFEPPRGGPFPYPPVFTHPVASWIDAAGARLGMHPYPVPRAIITRPAEGRGACVYCSLCGSYGCEVGAKSSTLAALIPAAERTGRCEVRPGAMVERVSVGRDGRARGVVYVGEDGVRREVRAEVVVVAASALESARLLLLSATGRHPKGLGNGAGQVGRNLCFSTLGLVRGALRYAGRSAEDVALLRHGAPFVGRAVQDFYELPPSGDVFGKGGTFHVLFAHPNPIHAAEALIRGPDGRLITGAALTAKLAQRFRGERILEVECFGEWLPTEGCRVDLDPEITDRWGLPAARITIARHPSDRAASEVVVRHARELLLEAGAEDVEVVTAGGETLILQHGTCRMGRDGADSVTTAAGELHEVSNVYVSDGGSLPSSGAVPSTMTIMANAFRIADGIRARLRS